MSITGCVFCSESIDTDFDTSNITIKIQMTDKNTGEELYEEEVFPFCGKCKDPDEISQILTALEIVHEVYVE